MSSSTPHTLAELHELGCSEHADRPALGVREPGAGGSWIWMSYRDLAAETGRLRSGLASLGVGFGDRVAIISDNRREWPITCYAVAGLGAVLVPMYEAQRPSDWEFILRDCGARVVIASRASIADTVRAMRLPDVRDVVGVELPADDPGSFEALCRLAGGQVVPATAPRADDLAEIIYTSGTTGRPKGAMLTHENITADIRGMREAFPIGPEERVVSFLPWAHVFGQIGELHHALSVGMSIAINRDLARLPADLKEVRPTLLVAVPSIFNRIYQSVMDQIDARPSFVQRMFRDGLEAAAHRREGEPLGPLRRLELALDDRLIFAKIRDRLGGRIKWVFSGGAALSREVAELIDAVGIPVYEGYGLTETSCTVSLQPRDARRLGTVGRPLPGIGVTIDFGVGDDPRSGEIVVHGPTVMLGYYNRPAENEAVFTPDGGLRTGDLGFFDEDGYLVITGRIKEIYKLTNGKYVVPVPIEEQIKLSPYIENVCLYGADRAFNLALVVPNRDSLAMWAERGGRPLGDPTSDPVVLELLTHEVDTRTLPFPAYQRPRRLLVLNEGFSSENGLLTPTLKVKRHKVFQKYAAEIERIYIEPEHPAEPAPAAPPAAVGRA